VHARAADRFATVGFVARIVIAAILAIATASAIADLLLTARFYQIAATVTAATATLAFALYCVLGFETRVAAHRALSHRLWLVAERYRSLLAEADEGLVDRETLLARRDSLIEQLHSIYERGFGVEQRAYEAARLPAITDDRAA
jgi:hypothetical protein